MKKKPVKKLMLKTKFILPPRKIVHRFSVLWNGEWHVVTGKRIDNGNVEFQDEHGRTFHSGTYKPL